MFLGLGLLSSFFNPPYDKISIIEFFLGFFLITYVYLISTKRQNKKGVFSQWSDPKEFVKMTLNSEELFLFYLGIVMIVAPMISFFLQLL